VPSTVRTFIAIEFSTSLRQTLGNVSKQLANSITNRVVNWVKPDLIHLTLKFLGDTSENALPNISQTLVQAVSQIQPFTITTSQLGCFPNLRAPRVVWIGLEPESARKLIALQQAVEAAIAPLGFPTEARSFSPHITLGRVRRETLPPITAKVGQAAKTAPPLTPTTETITSVVLMKSDLRPGGPVYTPLFTINLTGG
jgi:RNA 2',3'-cyclic 3'-phosphodiesterase